MEENNTVKKKTVSGLIWRFAERFGAQIVSFIVSVVLARMLGPTKFGIVAEVLVFTTILQVFVDNGLGNSLIQKKDADQLDFSTVFYFNIILCLLLYALIFFTAPFIAMLYKKPEMTALLRVLGLTVVISSVKNIQQAYVSRNMIFKKFFFATLGGTLLSAGVGIVMAYYGFGVWAIIAQQLSNLLVDTIVLWITVKWRPTWEFSFERLKGLFSYGWKLTVSALVDTIYNNVRQLFIGKLYSEDDLAFYNRGKNIPNMIVTNVNSSIDSVLLPAMASAQDDKERVKQMTRRSIRTASYIMWPLMVGLVVIAEPLVHLMYGDAWMESVQYLRIFCIISATLPITTANLNAIKAVGRSDIFLILEVIKKTIGLIILVVSLQFGVFWIAASLLIYNIIALILNMSPNVKLLRYHIGEQLADMLPSMGLSVLMGAAIYPAIWIPTFDIVKLILMIVVGMGIYLGGSLLFKIDSLKYLLTTGKEMLKHK